MNSGLPRPLGSGSETVFPTIYFLFTFLSFFFPGRSTFYF